jgi:protein SMG6
MRGMEWVGRRVFERGYWKSNDEKSKEAELLDASEGGEVTDGIIIQGEDEDKEGSTSKGTPGGIRDDHSDKSEDDEDNRRLRSRH